MDGRGLIRVNREIRGEEPASSTAPDSTTNNGLTPSDCSASRLRVFARFEPCGQSGAQLPQAIDVFFHRLEQLHDRPLLRVGFECVGTTLLCAVLVEAFGV